MTIEIPGGYKGLVIGCPLPFEFYRTTGTGQSPHQIHAGSYHDAMRNAGVELGNLMPYTSILPRIAKEIPLEEGIQRLEHGAEMKVIQAAAHVDREKGEKRATAAILYGFLYPKYQKAGKHEGGLVCEYNGNGTIKDAKENLIRCLEDLYKKPNRKGISFSEQYDLRKTPLLATTIEPKERFGTALSALAFVSYIVPILGQNVFPKDEEAFALAQSAFGQRGL